MEQKQTRTEQAAGCALLLLLTTMLWMAFTDCIDKNRHEQRIRRIEQRLLLDVEESAVFVPKAKVVRLPKVKAKEEESR